MFARFLSHNVARFTLLLLAPLAPLSLHAQDNGVMMQYFHWYHPGDVWLEVEADAQDLADAGITAIWLPPAYKAQGGAFDVGYGVYDLYDLGEFNQKGSVATKYGTKAEYLDAIDALQAAGIQVYADVVLNHKGSADDTEWVTATRVDWNNRNNEYGGDTSIQAWTKFDFPGRGNTYSSFKWRWYHFDGVDWAQNLSENTIFKFRGTGKAWDWEVDSENGNYDYLLHADIDMDHPDVVSELKTWGLWYLAETGVDGFRMDAVKHIKYSFLQDWITHLRTTTGDPLFTVAEFWSYDKGKLHNFITKTGGTMHLFDAPLHLNFHNASTGGGFYDMRTILDNTLMKEQPSLAVTLVENHDTQPCQALASPVADWFKPLAYAIILLRQEGYPNIFYADYYGASYTDCGTVNLTSHKAILDILLDARKSYAYGAQYDYFDNADIIGWTRHGDAQHPEAMAVILSDGPGGSKWMDAGRANTDFTDVTGNYAGTVTTDANGWGDFPVNGGSVSVWVEDSGTSGTHSVCFTCYNGTTYWGQDVYVVGSIPALGNWNTGSALKLDPDNYPTWDKCFDMPDATPFEWKCIKKDGGTVVWQSGANNNYSGSGGSTSGSF